MEGVQKPYIYYIYIIMKLEKKASWISWIFGCFSPTSSVRFRTRRPCRKSYKAQRANITMREASAAKQCSKVREVFRNRPLTPLHSLLASMQLTWRCQVPVQITLHCITLHTYVCIYIHMYHLYHFSSFPPGRSRDWHSTSSKSKALRGKFWPAKSWPRPVRPSHEQWRHALDLRSRMTNKNLKKTWSSMKSHS